jgi:hypothetical protein
MHAIAHSLAAVLAFVGHLGHAAATLLTALDDSISGGGPT